MAIAFLYLVFGIGAWVYAAVILRQRRTVKTWPSVTGKIHERKVDLSPGGRAGKISAPAFRYEALVKYSYRVADSDYSNDKLYRLGWVTSSRKDRERFLATLPDQPPVYYNPADPQDSCLLPPGISSVIWGLVIGTVVTLSAALYLLVMLLQ